MSDVLWRIRSLDVSMYDAIPTQTSEADRRALLGVHRAVMNKHGRFAYLEIGSHLGGSIQPYLLNPACTQIYSIDSRPLSQPDDRENGSVAHYPGNSTHRMLNNLRSLDQEAIGKVRCFEMDARDVDQQCIVVLPMIAFVDGEHTHSRVITDVEFCRQVSERNAVIVLHDFQISGIFDVLERIKKESFLAYLIEGSVFAIFLDPTLVHEDDYLRARYLEHRHYHRWFAARRAASRVMPRVVMQILRGTRAAWARTCDR